MYRWLTFSFLCFTILFVYSCFPEEEEIQYPGFAEIILNQVPSMLTSPEVTFSGSIDEIGDNVVIEDYGFLIKFDVQPLLADGVLLTLEDADMLLSLGSTNQIGSFETTVNLTDDLGLSNDGSLTYIRAYAVYDQKTVYSIVSSTFEFIWTSPVAYDSESPGVDRYSITMGIDPSTSSIAQYGICWTDNTSILPTLDNAMKTANMGEPSPSRTSFTESFKDLSKDTDYVFRGYIIDDSQEVYYSNPHSYTSASSGWQTGVEDGEVPIELDRGMTGFSIGDKGYFGLGVSNGSVQSGFWEYDISTDEITAIPDFPGTARKYAVAFSINGKGYVGLGGDDIETPLIDFWEYDPDLDSWTQKADFIGGTRIVSSYTEEGLAVFTTDSYGYVGLGLNSGKTNFVSDIYKFDPVANTWTLIAAYPGGGTVIPFSGSLNNNGIVGLGISTPPPPITFVNSFWSYNESSDSWSSIDALPNVPSSYVGYKVGSRQFIFGSSSGSAFNLEYVSPTGWTDQDLPTTFSTFGTENILIFSFSDRAVTFTYSEFNFSTIEFLPPN